MPPSPIHLHRNDSLHVTDIEDLADYLQSLKALHGIGSMERDEILKMLSLHEEGGAIDLRKEYGTFIARKRVQSYSFSKDIS